MNIQGKRIRLAYGSNFIMDPGSRTTMAAIQLVRAFMKGTQDISITDSANESSRQLLRSLGFNVVPIYSLLWARPLRPSRYTLHGVSRLKKSSGLRALGAMMTPACYCLDTLAVKSSISPFHQERPKNIAEELSTETLLELLVKIPAKNWLLPEYDKDFS